MICGDTPPICESVGSYLINKDLIEITELITMCKRHHDDVSIAFTGKQPLNSHICASYYPLCHGDQGILTIY